MASTPEAERAYDVVLLGATGFTGGLTAEYLARHAPAGCRWAIAGRDPERLATVRARLAEIDPDLADLPLLTSDVTDPPSIRALAAQSRVLATTVGPYVVHGAGVVAACADLGTDYVDLTGESEFVDRMYVEHHDRAVETGARLVHCCGFDSVPYDLGVQYTMAQLPTGVPVSIDGFVQVGGKASAGTYHTAVTVLSRRGEARRASRARRTQEQRPGRSRARAVPGRLHRAAEMDAWAVPLPTIDPQVVARSARALDYAPDFVYRHYAAMRRLRSVAGAVTGAGAVMALAQLPPTRTWLMSRMSSGQGPSQRRREQSWFRVTFVASAGPDTVITRVSGGDPGYDETAKMLAESALCLAFDDLPGTAGQVTTAVAMGSALRKRLVTAGIRFEVADRKV